MSARVRLELADELAIEAAAESRRARTEVDVRFQALADEIAVTWRARRPVVHGSTCVWKRGPGWDGRRWELCRIAFGARVLATVYEQPRGFVVGSHLFGERPVEADLWRAMARAELAVRAALELPIRSAP